MIMQKMGTTTTMNNFRDTIMKHIKNQHSLNPTQISLIQDRLKNIVSQFHTPHHLPYAAMIQRALLELKQKGGCSEKSISEFIKREYNDLPWAHSSLLKHHLGFLSERGEIAVNRRSRYSLCGAGSSLGSMKGGKMVRRKKWKCNFERKRTKKLKLAIVVRSREENDDQNAQEAENAATETERSQTDGIQTPKQDGTIDEVQLQLITDGGENGICSGSKVMDVDLPPVRVLRDGPENQVELEQKQQQQEDFQLKPDDLCHLHAMEPQAWSPNEDAIHELLCPKSPPGIEFMGVEVSDNQECSSIMNPHPLQEPKLIATEVSFLPSPTGSSLPSEKKKKHKNALPTPVAEKLENNLPLSLQPIEEKKQEKKKGRYLKGGQLDEMLKQREVLLALPQLQKRSPHLRGRQVQNERACRQLRRWSGDLPDISNTQLLRLPQQNKDMPLSIHKLRGRRSKGKTDSIDQDELPLVDKQ